MAKKQREKKQKSTLFEALDSYLFTYVDQFLKSTFYQKMTDQISDFGQKEQKLLNHGFTFLTILLPLIVTGLVLNLNLQLKDQLALKKDMLTKIHAFEQKQSKVNNLGPKISSPISITNQKELEQMLSSRMTNLGIEKNKVKILKFSQLTQTSSFAKSSIKIRLQELTMSELTNLLMLLVNEYKMRTTLIDLGLDKASESLQGMIELVHLKRI